MCVCVCICWWLRSGENARFHQLGTPSRDVFWSLFYHRPQCFVRVGWGSEGGVLTFLAFAFLHKYAGCYAESIGTHEGPWVVVGLRKKCYCIASFAVRFHQSGALHYTPIYHIISPWWFILCPMKDLKIFVVSAQESQAWAACKVYLPCTLRPQRLLTRPGAQALVNDAGDVLWRIPVTIGFNTFCHGLMTWMIWG